MWLDAFAGACNEQGVDYVDRLRHTMADYSPHVLALAQANVTDYGDRITALELDFRNPLWGLKACAARSVRP